MRPCSPTARRNAATLVMLAALVVLTACVAIIRKAWSEEQAGTALRTADSAAPCPNDGIVRFGVEPYGPAQEMTRVYSNIAELIGQKLGCKVDLFLVHSYNAEIEAMRSRQLEFGQFGPLGYVLATRLAGAQAVAAFADEKGQPATYSTSILVRADSGLRQIGDLKGRSIAYTDPVSTSGHLLPARALREYGIDPHQALKGLFTGSPAASLEALRNRKVDAAAISSVEIAAAARRGHFAPAEYVTLWQSEPIPTDPIAVRRDLPPAFKARLTQILTSLDLRKLPAADQQFLISYSKPGLRTVPQSDAAFETIRGLMPTLNPAMDQR